MVDKLQLACFPKFNPYKLYWLKKDHSMLVDKYFLLHLCGWSALRSIANGCLSFVVGWALEVYECNPLGKKNT